MIFAYSILFGIYTKVVLRRNWAVAVSSTIWMLFLLPVYLFICLTVSYDFKKYAKRSIAQIRMRFLNKNSQTLNFKSLLREKLELESELLKIIKNHKDEIKDILENQITNRDLREELTDQKIEDILHDVY